MNKSNQIIHRDTLSNTKIHDITLRNILQYQFKHMYLKPLRKLTKAFRATKIGIGNQLLRLNIYLYKNAFTRIH